MHIKRVVFALKKKKKEDIEYKKKSELTNGNSGEAKIMLFSSAY